MSEASPDFHSPPALPAAPPRRAKGVLRRVDGRRSAAGAPCVDDEPSHPLDPPLEDVRIPVKEPHADATAYSRNALRHQFPGAQVGDDLHMLFSEPGRKGQSRLSPDVLVALDVPRPGTRADYDADVLGPPDFILEVLSRSTWRHDLGRKLKCYQRIGVRECLLFDVAGEDRSGTGKELWGYALTPDRLQPLEVIVLPNGERGVRSAALGLVAYVAERTPPSGPRETWALTMRWHDPATGADIPDYEEARAETQTERTRADAERTRADAAQRGFEEARAEAQTERTRADAERTRADAAQRGFEEARAEAQTERTRADAERTRADAAQRGFEEARAGEVRARGREAQAQRRIAELEEQLRLRGGP